MNKEFSFYDSDYHGCTYNNNWNSIVYGVGDHPTVYVTVLYHRSMIICRFEVVWILILLHLVIQKDVVPQRKWITIVLVRLMLKSGFFGLCCFILLVVFLLLIYWS